MKKDLEFLLTGTYKGLAIGGLSTLSLVGGSKGAQSSPQSTSQWQPNHDEKRQCRNGVAEISAVSA